MFKMRSRAPTLDKISIKGGGFKQNFPADPIQEMDSIIERPQSPQTPNTPPSPGTPGSPGSPKSAAKNRQNDDYYEKSEESSNLEETDQEHVESYL